MSETPPQRIVLGQNNYGKSEVRLFKVRRDTAVHEVWDLDVRVTLEGDFDDAHYHGDNSKLLATDTMRNTVYALAKDRLTGSIEHFGLALVDHFLEAGPTVTACRVEITQLRWRRIAVDGQPHDHSFVCERGERKAHVQGDSTGGWEGYGYQWWVTQTWAGWPAAFALGYGGQHVFIVPGLDLVVVAAVDRRVAPEELRSPRPLIESIVAATQPPA